MPDDIENYVHRIGRTGRGNSKGHATTLVNKSVETAVLLGMVSNKMSIVTIFDHKHFKSKKIINKCDIFLVKNSSAYNFVSYFDVLD